MQRFYGVEVEDGAPGAWALAPGGVAAGMRQRLVLPGVLGGRARRPRPSVGAPAAVLLLELFARSYPYAALPRLPNRPPVLLPPCNIFPAPARAATLGAAGARCLRRSLSLSLLARGALRTAERQKLLRGARPVQRYCCAAAVRGRGRSAGSERQRRRQALGRGQICRLRHCTAFRCPALPYHAPRTLVTDERVGWGGGSRHAVASRALYCGLGSDAAAVRRRMPCRAYRIAFPQLAYSALGARECDRGGAKSPLRADPVLWSMIQEPWSTLYGWIKKNGTEDRNAS
jgi:hypothetical protein